MTELIRFPLLVPVSEDDVRPLLARLRALERVDDAASADRISLMDFLASAAMGGTRRLCDVLLQELEANAHEGPVHKIAHDLYAAHLAIRREEPELAQKHAVSGRTLALAKGWESEVAALCMVRGSAYYRSGRYELARQEHEEALVAARRSGSPDLESRASMNLGLVLKNSGDLIGAERVLRTALVLAASSSSALRARCELNLAVTLTRRGSLAEAQELARSAMQGVQALGLQGIANSAMLALGRAMRMEGRSEEAKGVISTALDQAREGDKPRNIALALEFLGDCELDLGNPEKSRELYREAIILARSWGESSDLVVECTRGLGLAELAAGDVQAATELLAESVVIARAQGDLFELELSLVAHSRALCVIGLGENCQALLEEAHGIAWTIGDRLGQGNAALELARRAIEAEQMSNAIGFAGEAQRLFESLGVGHLAAEAEMIGKMFGVSATQIEGEDAPLRLDRDNSNNKSTTNQVAGFLTVDPRVRKTLATVKTLAPQTLNILILGESGTGKELIAQAVHKESGRKGPFVPINCSAFPGDLIEGELFGHARGAYTGADRERVGLFEHANKGTLFLDEIGDMPIKAQARLLRVLENGEVRRLGENTARTVDVRIVAATHRHLLEMVGAGEFRLDLYYRLAGYVVDLPPIRERTDDARLIIDHYFQHFASEQGKSLSMTADLRQELAMHSWPGNVREIRLMMQRLVSLTGSGVTVRKLPFALEGDPRPRSLPELLEAEEKRRILDALQAHNWNKARAATTLGTNRTTLIGKMKRMGIELAKQR